MYDYDEEPQGMPALTWGFIFAIVLTVASIASGFLLRSLDLSKVQNLESLDGNTLGLLIWVWLASLGLNLACCAGAGFLTARDTGSIKAGAFAGGLALFAATFIAGIISFALSLASPVDVYLAGASAGSHVISAGRLAGAGLVGTICGSVCSGLWGAALGALGAIPARLIWGPAEG
jgi:hypothetical protein